MSGRPLGYLSYWREWNYEQPLVCREVCVLRYNAALKEVRVESLSQLCHAVVRLGWAGLGVLCPYIMRFVCLSTQTSDLNAGAKRKLLHVSDVARKSMNCAESKRCKTTAVNTWRGTRTRNESLFSKNCERIYLLRWDSCCWLWEEERLLAVGQPWRWELRGNDRSWLTRCSQGHRRAARFEVFSDSAFLLCHGNRRGWRRPVPWECALRSEFVNFGIRPF